MNYSYCHEGSYNYIATDEKIKEICVEAIVLRVYSKTTLYLEKYCPKSTKTEIKDKHLDMKRKRTP